MNMHGIMIPRTEGSDHQAEPLWRRVYAWAVRQRMFLFVVALPTLLLAGYLFLIASDQYESEAHFLVRSYKGVDVPASGMSQALSMMTGSGSAASSEAMSVADYLSSHDAVASLRKNDNLVERFRRPGIDFISKLWSDDPSPERLLKYYRRQIKVEFDQETGITTLKVHAFRPDDSYALITKLLQLGEQRVNVLNTRSYHDSVALARQQLSDTENQLAAAERRVTQFRQGRSDIDPKASGEAQITLVAQLTGQLTTARAQLAQMGKMINHASPQYKATEERVRALETQVAGQSARLAGNGSAIAAQLGDYEGLKLRQEFLAKRYEAAAASLDRAQDQAIRQQLYLARVVDANMPVKSQFPERGRILLTVVIALLLIYSISWLIVAGVREHAA